MGNCHRFFFNIVWRVVLSIIRWRLRTYSQKIRRTLKSYTFLNENMIFVEILISKFILLNQSRRKFPSKFGVQSCLSFVGGCVHIHKKFGVPCKAAHFLMKT